MNSKLFRQALLALFVGLTLAACETTHYDYVAPQSDQGRLCVTQCGSVRETCNGNEILRAQNEKYSCERSNDVTYRACMHKAKNKDQEKDCERRRSRCWGSENTGRCDANYRECFVNCGGTIRTYKK